MNGLSVRVLLIEDNHADAMLVHEFLNSAQGESFLLRHAETLKEGLEILARESFDIILADLSLPDSSWNETFPELRQRAPAIPIVLMTGLNDRTLALDSVQKGCQDYLVKGNFSGELLIRSIRYAIERQRLVTELQTLSISDSLTGLHNRRSFFDMVEHHEKMARRNLKGFLVFFADLDGLKKINDGLGHQEGDRAIVNTARALQITFRDSDVVARIGGDEFAVLALEDERDSVGVMVARLQRNLKLAQEREKLQYPLSLSLGFAFYDPRNPSTIQDLLAEADAAMYDQKQMRLKS